jgi:MSHA biogenesis protein MshG
MRALAGLQESSTNPAMREVLRDVRESLDSGRELSVSLARHPKVFSPFYLSMVRVGEMTGLLEESSCACSTTWTFERFMREQVKSALRYPMFVVIAMAVAIVVVNIFVIPGLRQRLQGVRRRTAADDAPADRLFGLHGGLVAPVAAGGSWFAFFAFRAWLGTTAGRYTWDRSSCGFRSPARSSARRRWPALPAASPWPRAAACRSSRP